MKDKFKEELVDTLKEIIEWSLKFKNMKKDFLFDIDDKLFFLSEKYNEDFKRGSLLLIYNLVDYYCDAIKHGFKKIDNNYSISEANNDINSIIKHLESSNDIQLPLHLEKKLKSAFVIEKNDSWINKIIKIFVK